MRELNEKGVNLERIKGNEEPRSKYFIIPEGDKTEIQYFSGIKANREDLNIKSLIEIKILENDVMRTSAVQTNALSAKGSKNLPRFVTRLRRRAMLPSIKSVMLATIKTMQAAK